MDDGRPENFRERLAASVRSIQWSYAIFWSLSTQNGILEWRDGYYNGDIKTRKTVQVMELQVDKIGFQRSEQLRELYESLLDGETEQLTKRPSTALSPEDLTNAEWYYLVCMSFVFNPGQGLPGRALANGQTIWLSSAPLVDSKLFSRSLLAKSASIKTVVCFPHLGGVVELGVTDTVLEDPSLIQHIKTSLLELSCSTCIKKSPCNEDEDKDVNCLMVDHDTVNMIALQGLYSPKEDKVAEFNMNSPLECSAGCEHNHLTEESFMLDGMNGGASQVHSWHFMDDDISIGAQGSINSSDCISQALFNRKKLNARELELQECTHNKFSSLDIGTDNDLHYVRTISAVLKSKNGFVKIPCFRICKCKSSFMSWRKGGTVDGDAPCGHQGILKKILFEVPQMYSRNEKVMCGKDFVREHDSDVFVAQSVPYDTRNEDDKFLILRSMVQSVSKVDKESILCDTIEYLKALEARVEQLESCVDLTDTDDAKARKKYSAMAEQSSDNCNEKSIKNVRKSLVNKRKARDIDETDLPISMDARVIIKEKEVVIEMRCRWREYLLVDIMGATNEMHLDAHSVQSSIVDGVLYLTIKAKVQEGFVASSDTIKQALWRVISRKPSGESPVSIERLK